METQIEIEATGRTRYRDHLDNDLALEVIMRSLFEAMGCEPQILRGML
jgi:hypothetical protein